MQIHELNEYSGLLANETFLAVDNGVDTGKVSVPALLADTNEEINALGETLNARIDNIIAGGDAPSEAEVIDARLGATILGGVAYSSLGDAIRGQATDITNSLIYSEKNIGKTTAIDGIESLDPFDFHIGNIYMDSSGWTYEGNSKRVCTKQGVTIKLSKGDIIGLKDYTDARFYVGWLNADSNYNRRGWFTEDCVVTEDGEYVLLLSNITEVTLSDKYSLLDLLFIKHNGSILKSIDFVKADLYVDEDPFTASNWRVGNISPATGNNATSSANISFITDTYLDGAQGFRIAEILDPDYYFYVFAYQSDGTYVGAWRGDTFAKSWDYKRCDYFDVGDYTDYKYRISVGRKDGQNMTISERSKVSFRFALGRNINSLSQNIAILEKSVDKYERIFQHLEHIMISDDGTSTWSSNISLGCNVMKTDERAVIIEIDPTYVIARVYIWENEPSAGVRYDKLYNWDGWLRAYIAPNTYFAVIYRNPTQTTGLTVETIQNNCRIMYYDEYVQAYEENGIRAFEEKLVDDMADYPIMFGVITDSHYPTGDENYDFNLHRHIIRNGCKTLKEIASRANAYFITNLGDDAGYSPSDSDESNIIQCMTTVDGMLRGGVRVLPVNGNHEAFQNHAYMDSTDFYRARMVNLEGVTKINNVATNYYFDDEFFKVRFVFFDVETWDRNDYSDEVAWEDLQTMFSTAPNDYKFILLCHKDIGSDATFPQSTNFYEAITDYIPRLIFQCSGHTHKDGYYENHGVRDIGFIAAGCYNYTGLTEVGQWAISDKESSFAIVGVNPSTMKVKVYGYGMAADRDFDFAESE